MLPKVSHRPLIVSQRKGTHNFTFQVLLHPTTPLQRSIVLRCTLHRGKPILLPLSLTKILRQRSSLVLGERHPETPYKPFTTGSEKTITSTLKDYQIGLFQEASVLSLTKTQVLPIEKWIHPTETLVQTPQLEQAPLH